MNFQIAFDYRFDTNGFFNDPLRKATLEAAGQIWSNLIQDEFDNVAPGITFTVINPQTGLDESVTLTTEIDDLLIFVGAQSPPFGIGGVSAIGRGGPAGNSATGDILRNRYSGSDFEPFAGNISFDPTPSFSNGVASSWFFDQTPDTDNDIPSGEIDFLETALHEIGHVLGIGTSNIFEEIGAGALFDGVNSLNINGGNAIPLVSDLAHPVDSFTTPEGIKSVMAYGDSSRKPTSVDLAMLADIGYEIAGFQTQGFVPPIATEGDDITIFGTIVDDVIDGLGGNDQIQGNRGNDSLMGGAGNDTIFGQDGDDTILGGSADDYLQGDNGNDKINGGLGNDSLRGSAGVDTFIIEANNGQDKIYDFDLNNEVIEIASGLGFTTGAEVLATLSKPFSNVSRFTLSSGNYIDVFHGVTSGTPLTAANFVIPVVNNNPIAVDDQLTINENKAGAIAPLNNDSDIDGDTLTITAVSNGNNGTVVKNNDGTVTYTPNTNFNGKDSFTYTISDGNGGTDTATVNVTVNPILKLVINNKGNNQTTEIKPYSVQDNEKSKVKNTLSGTNGLRIDGNGWKGVNIGNYQVTANTVLEFEFYTTSEGEIQGIGLDNDDNYSNSTNRIFQLFGTQTYGNQVFNNYQSSNGWKRYSIKVGDYFTGNIDRLTFINDDDRRNPISWSAFRNISLKEVNPKFDIKFDINQVKSYSNNQDSLTSKIKNTLSGTNGIRMDGNSWKSLEIGDYLINPNTVLNFEFYTTSEGEIQGIGLDNDNDYFNSRDQIFQLFGTQTYGNQGFNNYQLGDGWKSYSIGIGQYFTGEIDRLTFINDDDRTNPVSWSAFRNVSLTNLTPA